MPEDPQATSRNLIIDENPVIVVDSSSDEEESTWERPAVAPPGHQREVAETMVKNYRPWESSDEEEST